LQNEDYDGMIIGGVAVSLLTRTRNTRDIDLVLWCPDADDAERVAMLAKPYGFSIRIPEAIEFAQAQRVLLLKHDSTGIAIDVSLGALSFEQTALSRRTSISTRIGNIPAASVEDLIVLKAIAGRPQDVQDIRALASLRPDLDERYILQWIDELAFAGEMDDIASDTRKIIAESRSASPVTKSRTVKSRQRKRPQ
jgi:hypothetical protein